MYMPIYNNVQVRVRVRPSMHASTCVGMGIAAGVFVLVHLFVIVSQHYLDKKPHCEGNSWLINVL